MSATDPGLQLHVCSREARETVELLRAERSRIETGPALPAIAAADCEYLDFFIGLFEDAAGALESIGAEIASGRVTGQADRLREIVQRASDGRRRCLEFFDSISLDIRNQLVKLQDLADLAKQIDPAPAPAIDRRQLFTRFFRR
jgi:hypothetical protein